MKRYESWMWGMTNFMQELSHITSISSLTELVPAVTMSFDEGHTHATISPLLCIMASQTNTALSLS